MNPKGTFKIARIRLITLAAVAALHITLITSVAFHIKTGNAGKAPEPLAGVMRLIDVQEDNPLPPPPPPPEIIPDTPVTNTLETIAEYMIEAEEITPPVLGAPGGAPGGVPGRGQGGGEIVYLSQSMISNPPVFPEEEIRRNVRYPPIAQRAGITGTAFLELFIDRQGNIQRIEVIRENPPNYGFGEAAVNAFRGIRAIPAEADGETVAVRYRYNISFTLK